MRRIAALSSAGRRIAVAVLFFSCFVRGLLDIACLRCGRCRSAGRLAARDPFGLADDQVQRLGGRGDLQGVRVGVHPGRELQAVQFDPQRRERLGVFFGRRVARVIVVERDQQPFDLVDLQRFQHIVRQPVGAVDRRHVAEARAPERQSVNDRFAEDDFVRGLNGLAVEDAAMRSGKVEVFCRSALPVVHAAAVQLNRPAVFVQQRERNATAKVFVAAVADHAHLLEPRPDLRPGFHLLVG